VLARNERKGANLSYPNAALDLEPDLEDMGGLGSDRSGVAVAGPHREGEEP